MSTGILTPSISRDLRESILTVAKNESSLTKTMVLQAEEEGLRHDQLTEIIGRVRRRLKAISVLECLGEKEARLQKLHQDLQLVQQLHQRLLKENAGREELQDYEARWVESATEWQGVFASILEDDKRSMREEAEETMRSTAPLELAEQCRDALHSLMYHRELLAESEAAARRGEISVDALEELRRRVYQQEQRVAALDKRACDPAVLI